MSAYRKNLLVGVTMLFALIALAWMIIKFGALPATWFADPTFPVHFVANRAEGINAGSPVLYRGVEVGRITSIRLSDDQLQVQIDAVIEQNKPIPANVVGRIVTQSALGTASGISLQLTEANPVGRLEPNAKLRAEYVGLDMLPPEFAQLAEDLRLTSRALRESNLIQHLDETVVTIRQQAIRAGELLENMNKLVADEKLRGDIHAAVANVRAATETANRIGKNLEDFTVELDSLAREASSTVSRAQKTIEKTEGHVDRLAEQMGGRLEQISRLLATFQSISKKVDDGSGTAGMLVNDPKLYQALVDTTRQLNATVADLQRLIQQWEQEGATFRLK
jgi:phospholipid/cholesterol/gamma-HCH transport system substrate-binding protein